MPRALDDGGLFFLDVETGGVEGWTWDAPILPSPGNRFVYFSSDVTPVLYDRMTERSYTWDAGEVSLVPERPELQAGHWRSRTFTDGLLGWNTGQDERLVFRSGTRYAVVNASLGADAWFELDDAAAPLRWWVHPDGTHLLMRSVTDEESEARLHAIDLSDGSRATVRVPVPHAYAPYSQVRVSRSRVTTLSFREGAGTSITHYDWALTALSSITFPFGELSQDGSLLVGALFTPGFELGVTFGLSATSIFDTVTGVELLRVKGALPSRSLYGVHDGRSVWLPGGSGLVLGTRDGSSIVRMDDPRVSVFPAETRSWEGLLIPSPDRVDRLDRPFQYSLPYCDGADSEDGRGEQCRALSARVVRDTGLELMSARVTLRILPGSFWDLPRWSGLAGAYNRTSWGLTSDELRMHLSLGGQYEAGWARPVLPLAVDRPPFAPLMALEVSGGDTCTRLRAAPEFEAESLACLADRVSVAAATYRFGYMLHLTTTSDPGGWVHVRTEDGTEGWLPLANLRWAE